ncbi:DUF6893 family small protein [Actinomadura vinacea]
MRKVLIATGCVAVVGLAAISWKELPALRRYLKIERM